MRPIRLLAAAALLATVGLTGGAHAATPAAAEMPALPAVTLQLAPDAIHAVETTAVVDGWRFEFRLTPECWEGDDPSSCPDAAENHVVPPVVEPGAQLPDPDPCIVREASVAAYSLLGFAYEWHHKFYWCYSGVQITSCSAMGFNTGTGIGYEFEGETTNQTDNVGAFCTSTQVGTYQHRSSMTIPNDIPFVGGSRFQIVTHPAAHGDAKMFPDGTATWTTETVGW
jgi:hypothetical protein